MSSLYRCLTLAWKNSSSTLENTVRVKFLLSLVSCSSADSPHSHLLISIVEEHEEDLTFFAPGVGVTFLPQRFLVQIGHTFNVTLSISGQQNAVCVGAWGRILCKVIFVQLTSHMMLSSVGTATLLPVEDSFFCLKYPYGDFCYFVWDVLFNAIN